jgi:hypothetical protein
MWSFQCSQASSACGMLAQEEFDTSDSLEAEEEALQKNASETPEACHVEHDLLKGTGTKT